MHLASWRPPAHMRGPCRAARRREYPMGSAVAGWTGLEPAASGVTGRRYNQLNYRPVTAGGT